MVDCPFEKCCMNADTWKCQFCRLDPTRGNICFKDKDWYAPKLPYIRLKELFKNYGRKI